MIGQWITSVQRLECEIVKKSESRKVPWSYSEAQKTVPYVRRLLSSLREHYIACWHFIRLNGHDPNCREYHPRWLYHRQEGEAALNDLFDLSVCLFDNPLRGIAIFRFAVEVELDENSTAARIAFWLYRDTRNEIESFLFASDLYDTNDLLCIERPIPETLKLQRYEPDPYGTGLPYLKRDELLQARPAIMMPQEEAKVQE